VRINNLILYNFKNHSQFSISLNADINCITGKNGSGKTNILDAIYLLGTCKSYFNPIDYQLIRHNETTASLNAQFEGSSSFDLQMVIEQGKKKKLKNNGKQYEKLVDHIGLINVIMITPDDIELIKGNSEERRRFLDITISQTDRMYLNCLSDYQKIVEQRNKQLKLFAQHNHFDQVIIDSYNHKLIPPAKYIHEKRQLALLRLQELFNKYYLEIQSGNETVRLNYISELNTTSFETLLAESLKKDMILERTTTGIHKDDLSFEIDGFPIKKFGSQGQNKSFIIALKLAQHQYLAEIDNQKPILLLDDIFEKIDEERAEKLIDLVCAQNFGQIIITDTHSERVRKYFDNKNKSINFVELNLPKQND